MTFVITQGCCNDASCISVCPVQCIRPRPGDPDFASVDQLYIDPATCIDCGACMSACPVEAISADDELKPVDPWYVDIATAYYADHPIVDRSIAPTTRASSSRKSEQLRVAIVGSGPAGCYAATALSEAGNVSVSIFERLPTPFGLIRAGVAPDHLSTKLMADRFQSVLSHENVRCYFNVDVGRDVSISDLLAHHHAIIYATGAGDDKTLGVPGEDLVGSHSALEFVSWYNGHPDSATRTYDLSGKRAVVIGNGNVALDLARIMTLPITGLESTDMPNHAIESLGASGIEEVVIAGRRAPAQASFTSSELRALTQMEGVDVLAVAEEVARGEYAITGPNELESHKDLLAREAAAREATEGTRRIVLRYLLTPLSINGTDRVTSVTFARNQMTTGADGRMELLPTDEVETIDTTLVLHAIGHRAHPIEGLPFDESAGIIPNEAGRVVDPATGQRVEGLYCVGWSKRGAIGGIGSNKACSAETVEALLNDFTAGKLADPVTSTESLDAFIEEQQPNFVNNASWRRIEQEERSRGVDHDRPRIKFIALEEVLAASGQHQKH